MNSILRVVKKNCKLDPVENLNDNEWKMNTNLGDISRTPLNLNFFAVSADEVAYESGEEV